MKKYSSFALLKGMLSLIKGKRYLLVFAVLLGTLGFLSGMGIIFFGGLGVLSILHLFDAIPLYAILILLVVSGFLRGFLRYGEQYLNHYMAFTLLALVRNKLFSSLRRQGDKVLDDKNKGELLSILQSDTESLEVFYAHTITPFFIALLTEIIVLVLFVTLTSFYFSLIALLFYLLIGALIPVIFYLSNKKLGISYRKLLSESENEYLNSCYGLKEILYHEKEELEKENLNEISKNLALINKKLNNKSLTFSSACNFLILLGDILIITIGSFLLKENIIQDGSLILSYMMLASSFGPVLALANLPSNLTMSFASAKRILPIIDDQGKIKEGSKDFSFEELEVKDVSFSYQDKEVLKDINLILKKGEIIGIEGRSGSGKSTLFKLLLHFEEPNTGHIYINQKDISSYSRKAISENISLFSQSTYLFKNTIEYNLRIAKKDATDEEIDVALKKACIYDKVYALKDGPKTQVNDLGDNFSSGERQRLGLARIFLADTPVVLLDEATSNVDGYNEALILNQLKKEKDKAIILISHKKSGLSICDKIYHMKGGKLCS